MPPLAEPTSAKVPQGVTATLCTIIQYNLMKKFDSQYLDRRTITCFEGPSASFFPTPEPGSRKFVVFVAGHDTLPSSDRIIVYVYIAFLIRNIRPDSTAAG